MGLLFFAMCSPLLCKKSLTVSYEALKFILSVNWEEILWITTMN